MQSTRSGRRRRGRRPGSPMRRARPWPKASMKAASFVSTAARHFRASAFAVGIPIQLRPGFVPNADLVLLQARCRWRRRQALVQPRRPLRPPRLNVASSRSCSATWWGQAHFQRASILKRRVKSSPHSTPVARTKSRALNRLGRSDGEALIESISKGKPLPPKCAIRSLREPTACRFLLRS
jgi:hypothetical protein